MPIKLNSTQLEDVVAHESKRGQPYDFILRLRSDFDHEANGFTAAAFVSTLVGPVM